MLFKTVILSCLLAVNLAQYPDQIAPTYPHRSSAGQSHPPSRSAPLEEPEYRVAPRHRSPVFNPAAVHYVNIGTELAGDYKFGYDTGKINDGQSFREETRLPDGSVKGAYGYIDGSGQQRIVKYTAGKEGYKVEGDVGPEVVARPRSQTTSPRRADPTPVQTYKPQQNYNTPRQVQNPSQQAHNPLMQAYRASQASYLPQEQAYNPPQQAYSPPQQTYNPPEQAYRQQQQPARLPQQVYRPPQQVYSPPIRSDRPSQAYNPLSSSAPQYVPRSRSNTVRQQPRPQTYDYDDDDYDNEINEPKIQIPLDTTLFSYNIGVKQN